MRFASLVIGLLATVVSSVTATALTYKLEANEKACFFTYVEQRNAKVAFYFAVSCSCLFTFIHFPDILVLYFDDNESAFLLIWVIFEFI